MPNKTHEQLVNDARNKSTIIALIYSPVELHEYIIEIISKDSDKFINFDYFILKTSQKAINFFSYHSPIQAITV